MSAIHQITVRNREDGRGLIYPAAATSIRDYGEASSWRPLLDPWLRSGKPPGRAYLNFGRQAAFIRWHAAARSRSDWQYALVLAGEPTVLTPAYALELPDLDTNALDAVGLPLQVPEGARGPLRDAIEARARSAEAIDLLVPLLAHALQEQRGRVTAPWTGPGVPEAVMWGLSAILDLIGSPPPVSFLTLSDGPGRWVATPGIFVSFRKKPTGMLPPDEGFRRVAANLAAGLAGGPEELRQSLARHGVLEAGDFRERVRRLTTLPPPRRPGTAPAAAGEHDQGTAPATRGTTPASSPEAAPAPSHASAPAPSHESTGDQAPGQVVKCPLCLYRIEDWDSLDRWRWDAMVEDYARITLPADANEDQRSRELHGAYVCCPRSQAGAAAHGAEPPAPGETTHGAEPPAPGEAAQGAARRQAQAHYLPASYGRFGDPVLLGFVGLTKSGKTHLLTSMVGKMGELSRYRISARPLDPVNHQRFLEGSVRPLLTGNQVLPGTPADETTQFADAFIMRHGSGAERVVVLFDVAGGELVRTDTTKEFLWIADGLFFVIDPDHIAHSSAGGDDTFTNVLNIVRDRPRQDRVSAAIVVNKADKARFEEPVARWLRSGDSELNALDFLRESADVYAYLDKKGAATLAEEPYLACGKATLHVASPTGGSGQGEGAGSTYPRGVTPRRVLRPLVAMLAMTGVLTGPEAGKVGV